MEKKVRRKQGELCEAKLHSTVKPSTAEKFREYAETRGWTVSTAIRRLIEETVSRESAA